MKRDDFNGKRNAFGGIPNVFDIFSMFFAMFLMLYNNTLTTLGMRGLVDIESMNPERNDEDLNNGGVNNGRARSETLVDDLDENDENTGNEGENSEVDISFSSLQRNLNINEESDVGDESEHSEVDSSPLSQGNLDTSINEELVSANEAESPEVNLSFSSQQDNLNTSVNEESDAGDQGELSEANADPLDQQNIGTNDELDDNNQNLPDILTPMVERHDEPKTLLITNGENTKLFSDEIE